VRVRVHILALRSFDALNAAPIFHIQDDRIGGEIRFTRLCQCKAYNVDECVGRSVPACRIEHCGLRNNAQNFAAYAGAIQYFIFGLQGIEKSKAIVDVVLECGCVTQNLRRYCNPRRNRSDRGILQLKTQRIFAFNVAFSDLNLSVIRVAVLACKFDQVR
jgi:hypothetical protein